MAKQIRGVPPGAMKGLGRFSQLSREERGVLRAAGALPKTQSHKASKPVHVKFGGDAAVRPVHSPAPRRYHSG
jgi:hypothetical protein